MRKLTTKATMVTPTTKTTKATMVTPTTKTTKTTKATKMTMTTSTTTEIPFADARLYLDRREVTVLTA